MKSKIEIVGIIPVKAYSQRVKRKNLIKWGSCVGKKPFFFFIDQLLATDIDDQVQFDFCEMIYTKKIKKNNEIK